MPVGIGEAGPILVDFAFRTWVTGMDFREAVTGRLPQFGQRRHLDAVA